MISYNYSFCTSVPASQHLLPNPVFKQREGAATDLSVPPRLPVRALMKSVIDGNETFDIRWVFSCSDEERNMMRRRGRVVAVFLHLSGTRCGGKVTQTSLPRTGCKRNHCCVIDSQDRLLVALVLHSCRTKEPPVTDGKLLTVLNQRSPVVLINELLHE